MVNTRGSLLVCCEDRSLRTLLRGTAGDSCLEFRPVCRIEDARQLLLTSPSAVFVLGVSTVREEYLVAIRQIQSELRVPVIVVVESSHEVDTAAVIQAGAIACLDYQDAMRSLAFLVSNIAVAMPLTRSTRAESVLMVSDDVTLRTTDGCLTDGSREVHLPPIPAAILESLALRPNEVVPLEDLIRAGWGRTDCAGANTLYQHIYELRGRLSEFELEDSLVSFRGRGYSLRNKPQ